MEQKKIRVKDLHLYTETFDGDVAKGRNTFIGGSDVGTIMGVNPYKSAYELYLEKTEQIERENIDDKLQIKLGHKMEQIVAELYEEETGKKVQKQNKSFKCKEFPFLVGHIDRKVQGRKKGLEIKTTSSFNKTDYKEGEIPPSHYFQCLFYMMITGMHDWDLATLRDNNNFYITHIAWDEELAQDMLDEILHFWDCVETKTWDRGLDGSDSTSQALEKAYPAVETPSNESNMIAIQESSLPIPFVEYTNVNKSLKELEEIKKSFENNIKQLMGDSEYAILEDGEKRFAIRWTTATRSGGYDTKKFLEDNPTSELGTKYKKADTKYRRFSIKEVKAKAKELENK